MQKNVNRSILEDSESEDEKSDADGQTEVSDAAAVSVEIPESTRPGECVAAFK